jgi:alpha-amylase/alpha-mannosidase (GH57 family)
MLILSACGTPTPTVTPTEEPAPVETPATEEPAEEPAGRGPLVIEEGKLYLAIIWHQHQPVYYKDPETGIYQRPWVRVHATKDYLDMAAMLEQYPDIHATFNITPSLIRQLDDLAAGAKDLYWVLAEKPASELTDEDKAFILARFFDTNPNIIARFPRYAELAAMRGDPDAWTEQDYRDLQILFNLAWVDPGWLAEEPLASLVAKERDYAESDKEILFAEHLRIIQEVIPYHAQLQESGQIEVTMTPFAHPILPLLVNTDLAQIALPEDTLPTAFIYGQDAIAQVNLGVQFYEDHFGMAPRGMWPAEGSVAEIVVDMIAGAGIQWIATDEFVLANSLPDIEGFTRDSSDTVQQADMLYQMYAVQGRQDPVAIIFRDHTISDKVGFEYSGMDGAAAAEDFVQRIESIRAELEAEGATGPNLVTVLLDGENAWEYYDNDGKEFLNEMYRLLSESDDIVTVTPSEYLAALEEASVEPPLIDTLWAGSWIDGTYSTWIGEDEENLAWEYLRQTREALQAAITEGRLDEATTEQAMTTMYIAEGSDWFWWYGADQNSGVDGDFDRQFRSYLAQIYTLIGEEVPGFVQVPIIAESPQDPDKLAEGIVAVTADGVAAEGEWDSAAYYTVEGIEAVSSFYYGFDADNMQVRIDLPAGALDDLTLGFYMNVPEVGKANAYSRYGAGETLFGFGAKRLVEVTFAGGVPAVAVYSADGAGAWNAFTPAADAGQLAAVLGEGLLEMTLPYTAFSGGLGSGDRIDLRLVVSEGETDLGVIPALGPSLAVVPALPIPNVFMTVADPTGDDFGPGTYTYPTDAVFTAGSFDLIEFSAGYDDENVIFRVKFNGPVQNVWGAPNGLSIQTIQIYIDADGPASGDRLLFPGANAALTPDFAWDTAIWAEGWTPGIVTPSPDGPVKTATGLTIIADAGQRQVTISAARSQLPAGDPAAWAYAVAIASQEGYPEAGVWRMRNVNPVAEQWRVGGGVEDTNHTRLLDILWPEDAAPTQAEYLSSYTSSTEDVGTLGPDDFPQVPMVRP